MRVDDAELAWRARAGTRLSQRAFARLIGAHPGTVAEWESGRGRLARLTRSLLRLIVADPAFAEDVLRGWGERSNSLPERDRARAGRAQCTAQASGDTRAAFAEPASQLLTPSHGALPLHSTAFRKQAVGLVRRGQ